VSPRPGQGGIFGGNETPRTYRGTPQPAPAGYASPPGTGPEGETCGSCRHCVYRVFRGRRFYKCENNARKWDRTRASDVLVHSPACKQWTAGKPRETGHF
jgi:hypothetical protein